MMDQPQSLRTLFASAKTEKESLESRTDSNSDSYRNDVDATIAKFKECQRLVQFLSLFSPNESLEEVATRDIPYLTVDYLLADLLQRSHNPDREPALRSALEQYEQYLSRLDTYDLLSNSDKNLYERYSENPSSFSLAPVNDAATRRDVKVARFREEKELKQKLEYLSQNQNRLQSDDEDVRKLYIAEINLYTHQAFQSLDLITWELSMLMAIRRAPQLSGKDQARDARMRGNTGQSGYSERLDAPLSQLLKNGKLGPLLSKEGKPLQPFTLLDRRSQLQQGVFRPGHNLPTMTIDEYLEEERKRGGIIEGGGQSDAKPEIDEDDMEKADEETMKARAWDEFKEANPRGSGNTLNRG